MKSKENQLFSYFAGHLFDYYIKTMASDKVEGPVLCDLREIQNLSFLTKKRNQQLRHQI